MPTRRGWGLGAAALSFLVLGRALGVVELVMAACAGGALLAAAVVYVRAAPVRVEADRALRPASLHAGATGDVEVTVRNAGARTSPTLAVHDPFGRPDVTERRWARFRVAPLRSGQAVTATYQLQGEDRGVYELGPLTVRLEDPFGLAAWRVAEAPVVALVVYPRTEVLDPISPGEGSRADGARPVAHATADDGDIYALREYHLGDDLRRVHWKATAKRDEVMIRHDDVPVRNAATVVLDLRQAVHTEASVEAAVSAAASVVHTAWRRRWPVRLVTSDGADSGLAAGHAHTEAVLARLAVARTDGEGSPAPFMVAARQRAQSGEGLLVVVTTSTALEAEPVGAGRGDRTGVTVVIGQPGSPVTAVPSPGRLVHVGLDQALAPAWAAAMGGRRRRGVVTSGWGA